MSVQAGFVARGVAICITEFWRIESLRTFCSPVRQSPQALSTAAICVAADGLDSTVALRFATGFFLAGVYPVGMKIVDHAGLTTDRGLGIGLLVGALTIGSAGPQLAERIGTTRRLAIAAVHRGDAGGHQAV